MFRLLFLRLMLLQYCYLRSLFNLLYNPDAFVDIESINLELDSPISEEEVKKVLSNFAGVSVIDYRKDEGYITPVEVAGEDKVFVSRIRKDDTVENGLNLWVVSDNLRKGAALNAVQIAELVIDKFSSNLQ